MIKVAIIEDEKKESDLLKEYIARYKNEGFNVSVFYNAVEFLTGYKPIYDIVFLDIQMPYLNGMDAAVELRKLDPNVAVIFVSNLAQYATRGYDVSAVGFLVKPVTYFAFFTLMERVLRNFKRDRTHEIAVHTADGVHILRVSDIRYIEIVGHKLKYYTENGVTVATGTLKAVQEFLPENEFSRCNNCYLVNLKYVEKFVDNEVIVDGTALIVSRSRKKQFSAELLSYFGDRM